MNKEIYSYVHIPFCEKKCSYCRFASLGDVQKLRIYTYCEHLEKQIKNLDCLSQIWRNKSFLENTTLKTIYFGGGTPWVLESWQIESIIQNLNQQIEFDKNIEITLESTPNNVTEKNLENFETIWITRLSIWIQSLNKKTLEEIGRWEKWEILEALKSAENSQIKNISVDFIIGLPYVKKWEIKRDIEYILQSYSCIKHVSVYMLEEYYDSWKLQWDSKYENITYPNSWKKFWINEEEYFDEYVEIVEYLTSQGFIKYEISNFAKPWYECIHNKGYWEHKQMLAFWLSSHGFIGNIRFAYSEEFSRYYKNELLYKEELSQDDLVIEKIMFTLRTCWIPQDLWQYLDLLEVDDLITKWYLYRNKDKITLTDRWVIVMDYILEKII